PSPSVWQTRARRPATRSRVRGSNPRPTAYKAVALPAELTRPMGAGTGLRRRVGARRRRHLGMLVSPLVVRQAVPMPLTARERAVLDLERTRWTLDEPR